MNTGHNTDEVLAHAFAGLEGAVPDADTEFAALAHRLDGLGRRRVGRTAACGLAVAAIAAAVTVGVTYSPGGTATAPSVHQVAFSNRITTTTDADGVERPIVTVDAGWLPDGAKLDGATAGDQPGDGGSQRWQVPYADGPGGYYVDVSVFGANELPDRAFPNSHGTDLTVQGHPARLFAEPADYRFIPRQPTIYIDLGHGQVASASTFYESTKLTPDEALAITQHVAQDMKFDQHEVIPVTARLTTAPAGAKIVEAYSGFDDEYPITYYALDAESPKGAEIGIGGFAEKYPAPIKGERGRDVQGKPTVIIHDKGRTILYIKGLFGEYTKLFTGEGAPTLDDLYLIADGIRAVE